MGAKTCFDQQEHMLVGNFTGKQNLSDDFKVHTFEKIRKQNKKIDNF